MAGFSNTKELTPPNERFYQTLRDITDFDRIDLRRFDFVCGHCLFGTGVF